MKTKTLKILYWILLILFAAFMIFDGIISFNINEESKAMMAPLAYPDYLMYIVGTGKILGGLTLLQHKFKTIREWAYAGFMITFLGASASWAFSDGQALFIIFPLIFLAVLLVIYFMGRKLEGKA